MRQLSPKVKATLSSGLAAKGRRKDRCPMTVESKRFCCCFVLVWFGLFGFVLKDRKRLGGGEENNSTTRHSINSR